MNVYKNSEIALKYNISKTSVMNWIEGALVNKNILQVTKVAGKVKILKNENNDAEMLKLSKKAQIYKSKSSYIEVKPCEEFYEIFSKQQIIEVINNLKLRGKIPLKFTYLKGGAEIWDKFYIQSLKNGHYSSTVNTPRLLARIFNFLEEKCLKYKKVNIVDVGPGNTIAIQTIIKNFQNTGKLNKYIAIDISNKMLEIAQKNIHKTFPEIEVATYIQDIEKRDITDILFENKDQDTINLVFYLDVWGNSDDLDRVLSNFRYSMDNEDLLILVDKIKRDNKTDFGPRSTLGERYAWIPNLLGIDLEECKFAAEYDELTGSRINTITLDKSYLIKFDIGGGTQSAVFLEKGKKILVWYHKLLTRQELFERFDSVFLEPVNYNCTDDLSHILAVCKAI